MNERGFTRRSPDLYVHSHGNLVRREQASRSRTLVWRAVVDGKALDGEHVKRAYAERAVLDALTR